MLPARCAAENSKVRQQNVFDFEPVLSGERDVLVRVTLRINNGGRASHFIPNHVRGMRKTRQIELFQDHGVSSFLVSRVGMILEMCFRDIRE
jgi:hypothetical protein